MCGKIKDFNKLLRVTKPRNWYWFKCSLSCERFSKRVTCILLSSYGNWNTFDFTCRTRKFSFYIRLVLYHLLNPL